MKLSRPTPHQDSRDPHPSARRAREAPPSGAAALARTPCGGGGEEVRDHKAEIFVILQHLYLQYLVEPMGTLLLGECQSGAEARKHARGRHHGQEGCTCAQEASQHRTVNSQLVPRTPILQQQLLELCYPG